MPRGSFGSVMMFVGAFLWGVAWTAYAGDTELMAVGLRGGLSVKGSSPLGEEQRRVFAAGDALAMWRLPWSWYGASGWGVGTRLLASVGVLEGEGATAGVLTAVPLIAFGDRDGRVTLDAGAGGALLTRHRFGLQDFGGPFNSSALPDSAQSSSTLSPWVTVFSTTRMARSTAATAAESICT
ncbi:MAG: acyloxyacyl hydrolase [Nitrospiraceae bacterium]